MAATFRLVLLATTYGVTATGWLPRAPSATEVDWIPANPVQGSLVQIVVRPAADRSSGGAALAIAGTVAGQPLHFERAADGRFHALAGIPIDARDSLKVTLTLRTETETTEQLTRYIPITTGLFAVTSLSVDPRFVDPPDSALAVRIAAERASARAVSRRSHSTPRLWQGGFMHPRTSRITSEFGQRREFNSELRSRHLGVDFAGPRGSPVVAANHGVVALVGDFYYAGNVIYLDHGRGIVTAYLHLSQTEVAVGDTVQRGEIIGNVGATGRVTGPHLHWVARYGTLSVNPLSLLQLDLAAWGEAREP